MLTQIAINTGYNLSDLRSDAEADKRKERIHNALTPIINYDMTQYDDTQFETPSDYNTTIVSDYSDKVNRLL